MALQITPDLFVLIWLSSVLSAVLAYALQKNVFRITKYKWLNVLLSAFFVGFFILIGALVILVIFEIVA